VAPRLALLVLIVDLAAFAGHHMVIVVDNSPRPTVTAVGWAALAALSALQLYHSLAGRAGGRPRAWPVTLAVQILLPFAPLGFTTDDEARLSLLGMVGFPAGSALLLLTGWRAWLLFTVVSSSMGVSWTVFVEPDPDGVVYLVALSASTGLAVYGLSRLTRFAEDLAATRRELARAAAERERLRVAQDTHDLLGLGLSAVALKCDLAGRLIGRDEARARSEIEGLVRLAAQAGAEFQAVTTGELALTLRTELAAAREVLASAGVRVDVHTRAPGGPPAELDAVLATVLREAVTNVLRHAAATRCVIELDTGAGAFILRVCNDGVRGGDRKSPPGTGGHGLTNLAARVEAQGGRLTANAGSGQFAMTARIPVRTEALVRPGGEDPLAARDPADGVDEVVGGAVLAEEPRRARGQRPADAVGGGQAGQDKDAAGG
jgi:two-component system sensor histidine kinase DesK